MSKAVKQPIDKSPLRAPHSAFPFFLGAALLLFVTFLVYFPSYRAGFLWDDDVMLTDNPLVKAGWAGLRDIWFSAKLTDYFPLTSTSFWLEWRLWGMNPTGYHVTNVLLHALSAVLLWRVLLRLLPSQPSTLNPQPFFTAAWCAALLFAVHPVCVASVTWITERKNTLSMVFYLLSLLFYFRSNDPLATAKGSQPSTLNPQLCYWLSLAAFALALLAKTSVVILPFVLLLCAWWLRGRITRADLWRTVPFFALALVFGLITVWFQNHRLGEATIPNAENLGTRLLGGTWAVSFYLWKSILPLNLNMIYPRWEVNPSSLLSYLPGIAWFGLLFWLWHFGRARHSVRAAPLLPTLSRALFFALAYFWLALLPVLGFFSTSFFAFSRATDHWQYLAIIGICAFLGASIAWLIVKMRQRKNPLSHFFTFLLAACLLVLLGLSSWQRQKVFAHPETLWRDTLAKNPKAWIAHNSLGVVLLNQGKIEDSIARFREALRLNPRDAFTHGNLGTALVSQNKLDEAARHYEQCLALNPGIAGAHQNYARILMMQRKFDPAIVHAQAALKLNPDNPNVIDLLGSIYFEQGKLHEAAAQFSRALQLDPNHAGARHHLGNVLIRQNKFLEAAEQFQAVVKIAPRFAEAHDDLGNTLMALGRLAEAEKSFAIAIQNGPNLSGPRYNLALLLTRQNRVKEAVAQYREALRLQPEFVAALNNLAWILATSREAELRNGAEAVKLAEKVVELSQRKEPLYLDTLNAAYAEAGRFPEAIAVAEEAYALFVASGQTELAKASEQRLSLYRDGKPVRE